MSRKRNVFCSQNVYKIFCVEGVRFWGVLCYIRWRAKKQAIHQPPKILCLFLIRVPFHYNPFFVRFWLVVLGKATSTVPRRNRSFDLFLSPFVQKKLINYFTLKVLRFGEVMCYIGWREKTAINRLSELWSIFLCNFDNCLGICSF